MQIRVESMPGITDYDAFTTMNSSHPQLTPDELSRYSRHIILPQVGEHGQSRLADARVLIIGMGGLGSPAALYMAAAGVGTLGLADFDHVELHNLQRQIIHCTDSVGQSKLKSAARQLEALNPNCDLVFHDEGIQPHNALDMLENYHLVVDGSDNFGTRYLVTDACRLAGVPLVYGSIFQFEGQVSFFNPSAGTPCYRCLFPTPPAPGTVPNCAEAGVFGALCGVIGSLQAMEAIKWIIGAGENLAGKLMVVNALDMEFRRLNLKKDPECPLCGAAPTITNLHTEDYQHYCRAPEAEVQMNTNIQLKNPPDAVDVEQANKLRQTADEELLFLDVREVFEREICSIPGSLHLPMGEVSNNLDAIPRDKALIIYCHHGGRSGQVTRFLRQRGYDRTMNLEGGIDAWARCIDTDMRRY